MVNIYALVNPCTNEIRYVGKTIKSLDRRKQCHIHGINYYKHKTASWVKSLSRQGVTPEIILLDVVDDSMWVESEQFWISYFKFLGANLTNMTNGGEGFSGIKLSDEHKKKISNTMKGRPAHNKGKPVSQETRDKLSKIAKEKNLILNIKKMN